MKRSFGDQPTKKPKGMLCEIHWPVLAELDEETGEGYISRMLNSEGGDVRELPRTAYHQFAQSYGHDNAEAFASVRFVEFDEREDGSKFMSGKGWVLDDEVGRRAALQIATKVLYHNSVDLSGVKVKITYVDTEDDDYKLIAEFVEWKFAATTSVGKPAFANAHSIIPEEITASFGGREVMDLTDDEVTAALEEIVAGLEADSLPPLVMEFAATEYHPDVKVLPGEEEVVASGSTVPAWEHFHLPEPNDPTPWFVGEQDENGFWPVWGHLGAWGSCHDGYEARCVMIPRPSDGYASFNQPGVITDRGVVETGPIFFRGGHKFAPDGDFAKAYGSVENGIADVRVVPGVYGPWACGVIRPGASEEDVYAARASRVSGHWKGGLLRAVVCVNSEGYNVPGSGEVAASFEFTTDDDGAIDELVAGLPPCTQATEERVESVLGPRRPKTEGNMITINGPVTFAAPIEQAASAAASLAAQAEDESNTDDGLALAVLAAELDLDD